MIHVGDLIVLNCLVCEYYVHIDCQDFAVSDCKECATYIPSQKDDATLYQVCTLILLLLFISNRTWFRFVAVVHTCIRVYAENCSLALEQEPLYTCKLSNVELLDITRHHCGHRGLMGLNFDIDWFQWCHRQPNYSLVVDEKHKCDLSHLWWMVVLPGSGQPGFKQQQFGCKTWSWSSREYEYLCYRRYDIVVVKFAAVLQS